MPVGDVPSVFVSSTCYDLGQLRADVRDFIESLGFDPVLSELPSFPINPDGDTVGSCLEAVRRRADIFILIVGGRYGSETDSGKSVTNLEYLQAKAKGIPVYVFVDEQVLTAIDIWKKNPDANFEDVVDSTKVFDFIDSLKESAGHWIYPFKRAQNITPILKKQLAYLFMDALELRKKFKSNELPAELFELGGESLQLIIERPDAWEYRLFSQVLADEIRNLSNLKRDYKYGLVFEKKSVSSSESINWAMTKIDEISALISNVDTLLNIAFVEAAGVPGEPGDPEHLVYVAEKVSLIYKRLIEWTIECRSVKVDDKFLNLVSLMSNFSEKAIQEIEEFSTKLQDLLKEALLRLQAGETGIVVEHALVFSAPDTTAFHAELERLK